RRRGDGETGRRGEIYSFVPSPSRSVSQSPRLPVSPSQGRVARRTGNIAAPHRRRSPIASYPTAPRPDPAESGPERSPTPDFAPPPLRRGAPATGRPFLPRPAVRKIDGPALRFPRVSATRSSRSWPASQPRDNYAPRRASIRATTSRNRAFAESPAG